MSSMRTAAALALALLVAGCDRTSFEPAPGGGGSSGGDGSGGAAVEASQAPQRASLVSAAAGEDLAVLSWTTADAPTLNREFALRVAPVGVDLSSVAGTSGPSPLVVEGLAPLTEHHAQLFQREGQGDWSPTGTRMRFRTAPVYFVDPAAASATPSTDPTSPGNSLVFAALFASQASANVWVTEGEFVQTTTPSNGSVLTARGISIYGGFAQGFTPYLRDPATRTTRLRVDPATSGVVSLVTVVAPGDGAGLGYAILDGLTLDGGGTAQEALDTSSEVECRSVHATGCNRGFVLEKSTLNSPESGLLSHCSATANDLEGILVRGSWRMDLFACVATDNAQEGCQFDPLQCPRGASTAFTAKADLRDCTFARNGSDGLDIDLRGPEELTDDQLPGGRFEVRVENVLCAENGALGCLVDIDYEAFRLWSVDLLLDRVEARANGSDGVRLDLDDGVSATDPTPTLALVRASRASANLGDGFHVSSESERVLVSFAGCLAQGNRGFGFGHSEGAAGGNASIVTSHCAVLGNAEGGFEAHPLQGFHANPAAWMQGSPWPAGRDLAGLALDGGAVPFVTAARQVVRLSGTPSAPVTLDAPLFGVGDRVEWNDDGIERLVSAVGTSGVSLDPSPSALPVTLAWFESGSVVEDLRPSPGSPLAGAGLTAPGIPGADLGPGGLGLPAPGLGLEEPAVAFVGHLESDGAERRLLVVGGPLDPATFNGRVRVVDGSGADITATATLVEGGSVILLTEPGSGWGAAARIEVLAGLQTLAGTPLLAPLGLRTELP